MAGLEVQRLSAGYGDVTVLRDIDLAVEEGGFAVLIGANGAGKSTLLRTISGLIDPSQGEIRLMGKRIDHLMPHHVVQMGLVGHGADCRKIQQRGDEFGILFQGSLVVTHRFFQLSLSVHHLSTILVG